MSRTFVFCLLAALSLSAGTTASAAPIETDAPAKEESAEPANLSAPPQQKSLSAARAIVPPRIDGKLDDAIWANAKFVADFVQKQPVEGATPFRRTEVAFAYDNTAIYVAARLLANGADDVAEVLTRRDETGSAERFVVSIDTLGDHRTAYSFAVTAAGVRADWYHSDDSPSGDYSYNPVWDADTNVGADGWTAELRIPLTQLRFSDSNRHDWRINFIRARPQDNEESYWIAVPKDQVGWSSWFGDIAGLTNVPSPARVELVPYLAANARVTSTELIDPNDPFAKSRDFSWRGGLDAKIGLGADATLDLTILPDFGQIEADPAVVNLSDTEVFLEERRPFFVEGNRFLEGNGPYFYFSRRIGGVPRGSAPGDFTDKPQANKIFGAANLLARLSNGFTLGALAAVTGPTYARSFSKETQQFESVNLEPLTSYNVLRLQKQFGESRNVIGFQGTGMVRHLPDDVRLAQELSQRAFAGGSDFTLSFADNKYELRGDASVSLVSGRPEAIARVQRSSAHYFQRPDQPHVKLDPNLRNLFGWRASLDFEKVGGKWLGLASTRWESPGYELNDMGRLPGADDGEVYARIVYQENKPKRLQSWQAGVSGYQPTNFGFVRMPATFQAWHAVTFRNFWSAQIAAAVATPGFSDDLTRGGPIVALDPVYATGLSLSGNVTSRAAFSLSGNYQRTTTGSTGFNTQASLSFTPLERLRVSLTPRYSNEMDTRQYVSTMDKGRPDTYDKRYIFATINKSEFAVQTRFQLSFSPTLAVELYAEPFASSGQFYDYGEVLARGSNQLLYYGNVTRTPEGDLSVNPGDGGEMFTLRNPDFTQISLRSTAVLRWEFLPGSTLHMIYQQQQEDRLPNGQPVDASMLGDAFSAAGKHVFGIKLTYWWSVN